MGNLKHTALLVLGGLATLHRAWAAQPPPPLPSANELKKAAKHVASAETATLEAKQKVEALASEVTALAVQHRALDADLKKSKTARDAHFRAAQAAYTTPKAPINPPKKAPPLPKLESLKKAQLEYTAFVQADATVAKGQAALSKNEADLEHHAEIAAQAAVEAEAAAKAAEADAASLKRAAADKTAPATAKAEAELAATQLKNAKAASSSTGAASRKARSGSGFASVAAFTTRTASVAHEADQARQKQAVAEATLREVNAKLALQNPPVPGCDLRRVPWANMTYPWLPWGTRQNPLKMHEGAWVCDEPDPSTCPGPPNVGDVSGEPDSALVLGDLDGDGKPEAALHIMTFCCDVSGIEVLFFKQDAECRLEYLGDLSLINSSGTIVGGAFVADLPFARHGENLGLGAVSGREHAEWRFVQGKLRQTKSVKTVVPIE